MAKLPHFRWVKDVIMFRGYSPRVRSWANDVDIRTVVSALRIGHLDPAGREITDIGNWEDETPDISVRLDRQANTTGGAANLQVQVNNAAFRGGLNQGERTTIAQVIVPAPVYGTAMSCHETNIRDHLENVVRSALLESSGSFGFQYTIVEG